MSSFTGGQCETEVDVCTPGPCNFGQFCRTSVVVESGFECLPCVAGNSDSPAVRSRPMDAVLSHTAVLLKKKNF